MRSKTATSFTSPRNIIFFHLCQEIKEFEFFYSLDWLWHYYKGDLEFLTGMLMLFKHSLCISLCIFVNRHKCVETSVSSIKPLIHPYYDSYHYRWT